MTKQQIETMRKLLDEAEAAADEGGGGAEHDAALAAIAEGLDAVIGELGDYIDGLAAEAEGDASSPTWDVIETLEGILESLSDVRAAAPGEADDDAADESDDAEADDSNDADAGAES